MSEIKPSVTLDRDKYELVKELSRSKWGIKKGNIKRYVQEAVNEKIERETAMKESEVLPRVESIGALSMEARECLKRSPMAKVR
jgi:hypothetical protein